MEKRKRERDEQSKRNTVLEEGEEELNLELREPPKAPEAQVQVISHSCVTCSSKTEPCVSYGKGWFGPALSFGCAESWFQCSRTLVLQRFVHCT